MYPEFERRDAGDLSQRPLVGGEAPSLPVVHDQPDIDAMLQRAEVHRVSEVIAYM